jgi:hypothetical protein
MQDGIDQLTFSSGRVPRYEHPWRCQRTYSSSKMGISWIAVSEVHSGGKTEELDDGLLDDDLDIPPSWSLYLQ